MARANGFLWAMGTCRGGGRHEQRACLLLGMGTIPQAKVKERRECILVEFEKMTLLLVEEERRLLQALKEEEEETMARLSERQASLDQQSHGLEMLLLRLEDRSQREPLQMLQVRPRWEED